MEDYSEVDKIFDELLVIKNKHRKYINEFKLKVLKLFGNNFSIHKISDKLKFDRKMMREWRNKRASLDLVKNKDKAYKCNRNKRIKKNFNEEKEQIFQIRLSTTEKNINL